jgi:N-acetyltransferase
MDLRPTTLTGRRVRLEPLDLERHFEGLAAVSLDPEIWTWTLSQCLTRDDLRAYLDQAIADRDQGTCLPFATIDLESGQIAGCTRFGSIEHRHRRVEIGWTWIAPAFQRSHINTEAKHLMFKHAFEVLGCVRVELKTNAQNQRSRNAMRRLGCVEEGTMRKHAVNDRGVFRDTVYYAVIDTDWLAVKAHIEALMAR